mmetsp:Transcript_33873/g.73425  ORF Transcript_33873/g.73425 Transcript_33873/m.73425 type:complete len:395 (-) Transcript_33873:246-1430(-)
MTSNNASTSCSTNSRRYQRILTIRTPEEQKVPGNSRTSSSAAAATKRKIGYSLCEARNVRHRTTAIVLFYPLAATSLIVDVAAESQSYDNYHASVLCVDRPGVASTDSLPSGMSSIEQIGRHADDVLAVLNHHGIKSVYILGVCLGHAYAVQVARRLLRQSTDKVHDSSEEYANNPNPQNGSQSLPSSCILKGLTLVAPFVSPACPSSWRIARLGASVPNFVLRAATSAFTTIGSASMPLFLTPNQLKKLISTEEQEEFGWSSSVVADEDGDDGDDENYARAVQLALKMHKLSGNAQAIEARLGADPSWQQLCDDFGKELQMSPYSIPIRILACREDKVAPLESVLWIADRSYGGKDAVEIDERVHSHEVMTMFGGPPGHPVIMHEIVRGWKLL